MQKASPGIEPGTFWLQNEALDHWAMWDDARKAIETCDFK